MCLAVPMQVMAFKDENTALVETDGFSCFTDISLVEAVEKGDYVIVHAGFAIEKLDPTEADLRIGIFRELAEAAGKKIGELR